ncbi:MAG: AMP-binding protein [Gemmatimonadaceae bacterium]|nr:AMP-binding protein [Gemmatimonadaceae bacterium]
MTLDSFSNQELPFELLGTRVPPVRALFSMQDARERPMAMGSLRVEQYHVPQFFTTNDLMLWMMDTRTKLYAVMNYSTELFERGTAEAFLAQLRTFLLSVLEQPERTIGSIALAPEPEHVVTPVASPTEAESVATVLAHWASEAPSRIAVRDEQGAATYEALWERVQRVAAGLTSRGFGHGVAIGISVPAGIDRVVATMGVLCAGGAVTLLDGDDPAAYNTRVAVAANVVAVIAADDSDEIEGTRSLSIAQLLSGAAAMPIAYDPSAEVLVTTAGEEGQMRVHHVAASTVAAAARDLARTLTLSAADVVLSTGPATAPSAVVETLAPLSAGATLAIASTDARDDVTDLGDEVEDLGATVLFATDSVAQQLASHSPWRAPESLRALLVAGACAPAPWLHALTPAVADVFTMFGVPASGGADSVARVRTTDGTLFAAQEGLAGGSLTVIDSAGRPCPVGIPGTLRVSRASDVWDVTSRVRRSPSGRIQFLGDDLRYLWIDGVVSERAAVEDALRQHPAVGEAAVRIHTDASGTPRVVAYVVATAGARVIDSELRAATRGRIPIRCVPQRIVPVESLPRAVDGQVVYGALASPFDARQTAGVQHVAPRTETETLLAAAWRSVLDVEQISVLDNFFRLGGTSLLCFRVVEQVRKQTGQHLSPRALLVGTLEQVAGELSQLSGGGGAPSSEQGPTRSDAAAPAGVVSRLKNLLG